MYPLHIYRPAFPPEKYMNATIAVTHTGFGNLADTFLQFGLIVALNLVVIARPAGGQNSTGTADTDIPNRAQIIDKFAATRRPQSFRLITS